MHSRERPVLLCFLQQQGGIARLSTRLAFISCRFLLEIELDCTAAPMPMEPSCTQTHCPRLNCLARTRPEQHAAEQQGLCLHIRPSSTGSSEGQKGVLWLLLRVVQNGTKENLSVDLVSLCGVCFPRANFSGMSMLKGLQITILE